ncbi:oxygen-independent coproporphyrinogen III oxidase [Marinoscillum sp. MHG1-6]|uniref:oxygen-independent coproporphyrinogen III oxidase n=1 Tax=Marinoscillum sp. MHG1-6 TaxID=2959627 RepID=UPI0021579EF4|nr:oxygen-independent coproporphyrinogen III oxidase [Marinoscillum sp. MHG1-6]
MESNLIRKYNIPGPRYTSYPTVPFWDSESFSIEGWKDAINHTFWTSGKEVSIYIHLPFCESLCTYCGCNTRITKNHEVEIKYINAVLKEWAMYVASFPSKPVIKEIHLGGGTPTFFSPTHLEQLILGILSFGNVSMDHEFAFEGHPNNTTQEHLETLYRLGFRRVSFGIQDFDPYVQKLINRVQPYHKVKEVTETAREVGFTSVNYDLIYGLPGQTLETVRRTIEQTLNLRPDRIAFYSYAHIPHLKPAQKSFEEHLPDSSEKCSFYELGKAMLTEGGYKDIGMDHFSLSDDALFKAYEQGNLHRNFMGYSLQHTELVIGLGVSAIGDSWASFAQNVKNVEAYYEKIEEGQLPILKGHHLTTEDLIVRSKILDLICRYQASWTEEELHGFGLNINFEMLDNLKEDELIELKDFGIEVTDKGRPFIRNICMPFDVRMWKAKDKKLPTFSKTI